MRKLIFIDDDPIDHFLMKHILRDKKYFDTTTYTIYGSLVLDYIEENKANPEKLPDMIFLDLNMPDCSGWEFLDRMQMMQPYINKPIKIYVMSSHTNAIDKETSSNYPLVSEFISKPIGEYDIERIVEN
jgi:CheY-like chemotaxis protein